ncbi:MAG TPA: glycosyltransferase [Opitutaceae bacterium]|nr:glycosyltransferase [Opitutaceae bacterium]
MRIAQIVPSIEARHGGPSRSVRALAGALAQAHDVELLTTEPATNSVEAEGRLVLRRFPRQWPQDLVASDPLRRHLLAGGHDIIHHHSLWLRPLHYAAAASRRDGVPLVISPRGMMTEWAWRHRRWKKFLARHLIHPGAFEHAAGWHATSSAEVQDIRRLGFTQPVCLAPNGVDLPTPDAVASARRYWLDRCPALAGRKVALFYSRFHAKKRVLELIELWAAQTTGDWLLLVVGIPEEYDVGFLRRKIDALNASARIEAHDGTAAPPPYPVATLYLLPTHSENFGLTVAEALAHGLPVITTGDTPWQELEARQAGRCVSWPDFRSAMLALMRESPDELARRGAVGRIWMQREFSWAGAAAKLADFYGELITCR